MPENGKRDKEFEELLAYMKATRAFDFGAYKRTTLARRVQKRVEAVGAGGWAEYQDYLEVHPDEFRELFEDVRKRGFVRVRVDGATHDLSAVPALNRRQNHDIAVVVDRLVVRASDRSRYQRAADNRAQPIASSPIMAMAAVAVSCPVNSATALQTGRTKPATCTGRSFR